MNLRDFEFQLPCDFLMCHFDSDYKREEFVVMGKWGDPDSYCLEKWTNYSYQDGDHFFVLKFPTCEKIGLKFPRKIDEWQFVIEYLSKVKNL